MKRRICILLILVFTLALAVPVLAQETHPPRLVDGAALLFPSEKQRIESLLDEISQRQQFDVVIVTVDSTDGKSPMAFADDYFDYNGYGMGPNHDGVLLLLAMNSRDWYVSTCGYGITAITDAGLDYIAEQFIPYLSDGDYAEGFECFANLCDSFVTQAKTGNPYDRGNLPKEPFNFLLWAAISLGGGFVVALIITSCMKRGMVSVRAEDSAHNYRKGGPNLTVSRDTFLYRNVSRRAKPKESSSSGGSSTHRSSSGRSHGGGGGKF